MSFPILILKYLQNSCHHFVTYLIKLAPLRPGLVRLAIFSQSISLTQYVVLFVRPPACLSACLFQLAYCLNDQAYFA